MMNDRLRFILIAFLTVGFLLQGCKRDTVLKSTQRATVNEESMRTTQEIRNPRGTASTTSPAPARPTATFTITKTFLATHLAELTSTAPVAPAITLTPLPTMDRRGIQGLIDNNGGCQLPCWWGIEPGRTTGRQALQFLENIPANISPDGDSGSYDLDGKVRFESAYQIGYDLPGSSQKGKMKMIVWDDIVTTIDISSETTRYRFTLDQLLSKMGKPFQIFIEAKYDAMGYTIPFRLILYYPDRRFFAIYYIEAEHLGKNIRACPAKVAPGLTLWSPEYRIENRLAREMLGPDSRPGLQTLEDATGLTIDDFFAIFSKMGFSDCLESPLSFWESLK